jgi:uncharacterized alpha-E superfamily protein
MANLLYLVGAVVVSALVCVVLWMRHRQPRSVEYQIDSFQRELRALAPDRHGDDRERRHPG